MNPYREQETIPFTKPKFWIRNGRYLVSVAICALLIGTVAPTAYWLWKRPKAPTVCRPSVELRTKSDDKFECNPDQKLVVNWGGGLPADTILVFCECK